MRETTNRTKDLVPPPAALPPLRNDTAKDGTTMAQSTRADANRALETLADCYKKRYREQVREGAVEILTTDSSHYGPEKSDAFNAFSCHIWDHHHGTYEYAVEVATEIFLDLGRWNETPEFDALGYDSSRWWETENPLLVV